MNKLRYKFKKWLDTNPRKQLRDIQCEQISDDFAIKFAEWINENIGKMGNDIEGYFYIYNESILTTTELLQIFKEKYYEI